MRNVLQADYQAKWESVSDKSGFLGLVPVDSYLLMVSLPHVLDSSELAEIMVDLNLLSTIDVL